MQNSIEIGIFFYDCKNIVSDENCVKIMSNAPRLIQTKTPICRISTDFPFVDLKSSKMNISVSCHSTLTLENVTINETAIYTCRARLAFKPLSSGTDENDRRRRRNIQNFIRYAIVLDILQQRSELYFTKVMSI